MPFHVPDENVRGADRGGRGIHPPRLLQQDMGLADFGVRRFRLRSGPAREQLETSARSFLEGFNRAVSVRGPEALGAALDEIPEDFRGFAYEGAGMGCALLDLLTFSRGRKLRALLDGPGADYPHMIHVGAGWGSAKLRLRPWRGLSGGDPMLRWLAWDGFGFYQGFFHSDRVVAGRQLEGGLGPHQRAFRDQGLGRCLWFHECADPEALGLRVAEFPEWRRADLWSGIGLAAVYAGGATLDELHALAREADGYRDHLAQGAAFACAARLRAGTPIPAHSRDAAAVLTGVTVETAAAWTDTSMSDLGTPMGTEREYMAWRAGIRRLWAAYNEAEPPSLPTQQLQKNPGDGTAAPRTRSRR